MELLEDVEIKTIGKEVEITLEEEILGIILGVPMEGIRFIQECNPFEEFTKLATKQGEVKHAEVPKKYLKGKYQLTLTSSTKC